MHSVDIFALSALKSQEIKTDELHSLINEKAEREREREREKKTRQNVDQQRMRKDGYRVQYHLISPPKHINTIRCNS